MSDPDTSNTPPPLLPRAECLLERIEAEGGEWTTSYSVIAEACGLARSTAQLAVSDLIAAGLIEAGPSVPRHGTLYRRTAVSYRTVPTPYRPTPTDAVPTVPTDDSVDAPARATPAGMAGAQTPLPTPIEPSAATRTELSPASAGAHEALVPSTEDTVPIGRLAVAAAVEAAAKSGRSVEGALKGRIGSAAQRLAGDGTDVATILAGARRLGEGGFADLYTAVRAVRDSVPDRTSAVPDRASAVRTAELMPTGETAMISPRIQAVIRLVRGTWPRAQIDAELWEEKLGKVQERFLLAAVDRIARSGAEFAPHWGQVYAKAREVGQPIVLGEQQERDRLRELEAHGPRYPR